MELHVLMPVYNDWQSAEQLLRDLDRTAAAHSLRLSATLVDDGSTEPAGWPADFPPLLSSFSEIEILHLLGNRGQQLAVTVGLAHLQCRELGRPVVLMDADGQDRAEDIPTLVAASRQFPGHLVLAERRHRPDGLLFRLCYGSFQMLFRTLVGRRFRIGIFGFYPMEQIEALLRIASLRRSVAGTLIASGRAEHFIRTDRGRRYHGRSHFGFRGHFRHAWNSLAANRRHIASRLSRAGGIASVLLLALAVVSAAIGGRIDLWVGVAAALAVVCGGLSVGLARGRRGGQSESAPTAKELLSEHVARVRSASDPQGGAPFESQRTASPGIVAAE